MSILSILVPAIMLCLISRLLPQAVYERFCGTAARSDATKIPDYLRNTSPASYSLLPLIYRSAKRKCPAVHRHQPGRVGIPKIRLLLSLAVQHPPQHSVPRDQFFRDRPRLLWGVKRVRDRGLSPDTPPARAMALARFLDYVQGHDKVWVCRREEIARHWVGVHPPGSLANPL